MATLLTLVLVIGMTLGSILGDTENNDNEIQVTGIPKVSLTESEQQALDQLRELVAGNLTEEFMRSDSYLLKWLKRDEFDVAEAKKKLDEAIRWRSERDTNVDFSKVDRLAPMSLNCTDIYGRPYLTMTMSNWDIRRLSLAGNLPIWHKWLEKFQEDGMRRAFETTGGQSTSMTVVADLSGFNLRQHNCISCVINWSSSYESYFPATYDHMIIVNAPRSFQMMATLVRSLMSPETKERFHVLGSNRDEWGPIVHAQVPQENLPRNLGGTCAV